MKTCAICQNEFTPVYNTTQKVCSPRCAIEQVNLNKEKKLQRDIKRFKASERKELRQRKEKLKSRSDHLKEAQTAFNAYIRERDTNENCISCGRLPKKRNAGHFKSVGAYPELRFHPFNCHLQCEHCNTYKSGNQIEYRISLLSRIGLDAVEWLEGGHKSQNLTIDDIIEIKQYYREQLKILKANT